MWIDAVQITKGLDAFDDASECGMASVEMACGDKG